MNKSAPHGSFLAPKLSSSTSSSSGAASASASSDVTTWASTSASTSASALTSGSASTSALASMSASMSAFVLKKVPASTATLRVRPNRRFPPIEVFTPCPCPRTHFFAVVVARRNDARAVEEREDVDANIIISVCLPLNSCSRSSCNGTARRRMTKRGGVIFYKKERLDIDRGERTRVFEKKNAHVGSRRVVVFNITSQSSSSPFFFSLLSVCPKSVLVFSLSFFFFLIIFFWKEDKTQKGAHKKTHQTKKAKEEEEEEEEECKH